MKSNRWRIFGAGVAVVLVMSFMGSCFLLKDNEAIDPEIRQLSDQVESLTKSLQSSMDQQEKEAVKAELEKLRKELSQVVARLVAEGKKIDLKAIFNDINEAVQSIGK